MANFKELALTKRQFEHLIDYLPSPPLGVRKHGVLIFQFIYDFATTNFNLVAYIMKPFHISIDTATSNDYKEVLFEYPPPPDASVFEPKPISSTPPPAGTIVLGDLQIRTAELDELKRLSNPADPEEFDYFHFTPNYDAGNQHLSYIVQVVPYTSIDLRINTKPIDPSPPATAR